MEQVRQAPAVLAKWQSKKIVEAGEITEVVAAGCYVKTFDGTAVLLLFEPAMTARYQPKAGDFWVIYANQDGSRYHSLCPRAEFEAGYNELPGR